MTATLTTQENKNLKYLLDTIGADNKLINEINKLLGVSEFSNVYINEIINALQVAIEIKNGKKFIVMVASMQSGKTGTIKQLCNLILTKTNFLSSNRSAMFTTSMTDIALYKQNHGRLSGDDSNIIVEKMYKFKNLAGIEIKKNNVKILIRDEDQYGCGKDSNFDSAYFFDVKKEFPDIPLVTISATPFDALDALNKRYLEGVIIKGQRPKNYYGITEMLDDGIIEDLPNNYKHIFVEKGEKKISPQLTKCIFFLKKYISSLGIIRASSTYEAIQIKNTIKQLSEKFHFEVLVMGSRKEADIKIKDGMSLVRKKLKFQEKNIVLIIVNALAAGHDLNTLKDKVRFLIETRKSQLANVAQGLPGRICGYHKNRDLLIYANESILKLYSRFENDPEIFNTQKVQNQLIQEGRLKSASTHLKLFEKQKEGSFIPVLNTQTLSVDELFTREAEEILNFLSPKSYRRLLEFFSPEFYNNPNGVEYLNSDYLNIRIASKYRRANRVFKSWFKNEGYSFNTIFPHNNANLKFGMLISNYPKTHPKNEINFCGIKVFYPGEEVFRNYKVGTNNLSMYKKNHFGNEY